jgi:hypothetical protein
MVSSAAQFLKALEDPSVSSISVMKPFAMPHGPSVKPAVVHRQVLITSPIRAMIDWCDKQCQAAGSKAGSPLLVMGKVRQPAVVWRGLLWVDRTYVSARSMLNAGLQDLP